MLNKFFKKYLYNKTKSKNKNIFHNYPFGLKPWANENKYLEIWERAKKKKYPIIDEYEKKINFKIEHKWLHNLALHTQVVIKNTEICYQHGRLLYSVLSKYCIHNNINELNILEVGTARGFSALCMAKSLKDNKISGKIITVDPLPHNIPMYWNCIDDNYGPQSRKQLLTKYTDLIDNKIIFLEGQSKQILNILDISRVHFAFLDGSHEYIDVKLEIDFVSNRQKKGDIIFFDDYHDKLFPGIVKAVHELKQSKEYSIQIIVGDENRGYAIATKGKNIASKK